MRELKEVIGWMRLGLELGVPKHTLESIRCQYGMLGEDMCMTDMLSTWLNSRAEEPTWAEVVSAVSRMGNRRVARKIAESHGERYCTLALKVDTQSISIGLLALLHNHFMFNNSSSYWSSKTYSPYKDNVRS